MHERIQHGLQVEGRATNDLEHIGCRGLLLQRFTQFVEQPRVLDGDDGLRGEIFNQFDLLVRKRTDLLPIDGDNADQTPVLEHRYNKKSSSPRDPGDRFIRIFQADVGNVTNFFGLSDTVKERGRLAWSDWIAPPCPSPPLWCVVESDVLECVVLKSNKLPKLASQMRTAFSN